ncbi:MAG: electron transport complex subunit RsxC [Pseudohongiellaceae bacterium]
MKASPAVDVRHGQMPGGITPEENKAQSLRTPIRQAPVPPQLLIPVTQPAWMEPELLVEPGQAVLKGQLIARSRQPGGIAVHASSSGIITKIGQHGVPNVSGLPETCVHLDTDGRDQWLDHKGNMDFASLQPADLLHLIAASGISGLGGAGFPAHVKLLHTPGAIHTLIINACECEPFISADEALMRERAGDIMAGIGILLQILRPRHCLIGIEDNKPQALAALAAVLDDERIEICRVPGRYPSGAERQLIALLTGEEIATGILPVERGILCQNVGTAHAIKRAICHGEPLISRVTTITGAALSDPGNFEIRIGTPIHNLLNLCGLNRQALSRLIMGGPLMGTELAGDELPLIKTSNCIIATTEAELPCPPPAQPCIRCGLCADVCPVRLLPQQLYWFARSREHHRATAHNLFDCIECGACAWVCPSSIPLVQYYRAAKGEIRAEQDLHARAEQARQRYESHQQRQAEEQARQEQRRRERAALAGGKARSGDAAQNKIQAALERVKARKTARPNEDKQ